MKTKQLINKSLTRNDLSKIKLLTTSNIAWKLLYIFRSHIGQAKAISRGSLFKKVFGRPEEITLADDLRWDYIKRGMHLCRQRTKCFIGNFKNKGVWKFFVLTNYAEAQSCYIQGLNNTIKAIRKAQYKAHKSVSDKHYKSDWALEAKQKKHLGYRGYYP